MKQPKEVISEWIERITDEGRNMTAWETGFMADITDQFERTGSLSDGQEESLERILAERTP